MSNLTSTTTTLLATTLPATTSSSSLSSLAASNFSILSGDSTLTTGLFSTPSDEELILRLTQLLGLLSGIVGNSLTTLLSVRIQPAAEIFACTPFSRSIFTPTPLFAIDVGTTSADTNYKNEIDSLVGSTIVILALLLIHVIMSCAISPEKITADSLIDHDNDDENDENNNNNTLGNKILNLTHRMIARLFWAFFISLLPTSMTFCFRLLNSSLGMIDNLVGGIAVAIWGGIAVFAMIMLYQFIRVQWLPVGGWLKTGKVLSIHREEFLKSASRANATNIQIETSAIYRSNHGGLTSEPSQAVIKKDPTMSFEDALLGTPEEASKAIKNAIDKRHKIEEKKSKQHETILEKNRHRALLKGERRGAVGKWINSLATEKQRSEAWHLEQIQKAKMKQKEEEESEKKAKSNNNTNDDEEDKKKENREREKEQEENKTNNKKLEHHQHKLRYGALFMDMRIGMHKFFIFELFFTILFGLLHGFSALIRETGCDSEAYAFTALLFVEAIVFIGLQPCRALADNFFSTLIILGNMASGVFLTTGSGRYSGFSRYFFHICEIIILALVGIKFIFDIYLRLRSCFCLGTTDEKQDVLEHQLDEAALRGEMNKDIYAKQDETDDNNIDEIVSAVEHNQPKEEEAKSSTTNVKQLAEMMKKQEEFEEGGISGQHRALGASSEHTRGGNLSAMHSTPGSGLYQVNSSRRIEMDERSPLKLLASSNGRDFVGNSFEEDQQSFEMVEKSKRASAIARLESYASKSFVEFEDDPEHVKQEKRKARNNLPDGIASFLALTPPDKKRDKKNDNNNNNSQQSYRLGENGLLEGLSLGPPIPITDLRLGDHSPSPTHQGGRSSSYNNNSKEEDYSPAAPLSSALKNAVRKLDEEALEEESGKQVQELESSSLSPNGGKESPQKKPKEEESEENNNQSESGQEGREGEGGDDGFSFLNSLGSRPGERRPSTSQPSVMDDQSPENDNYHNNNNINKIDGNTIARHPDENYSPPNPLASDSLMQKLDSITSGGTGADINMSMNNSSSAKKKLQSLELAGNFLKGAFSVPVIPAVHSEHQRNPNKFIDPYYSSSRRAGAGNPLDHDFDEELPILPKPPVRIDQDDYYGNAHTNHPTMTKKNSNNNGPDALFHHQDTSTSLIHSILADTPAARREKQERRNSMMGMNSSSSMMMSANGGNNNNNNEARPLFSGYFAPTPNKQQNSSSMMMMSSPPSATADTSGMSSWSSSADGNNNNNQKRLDSIHKRKATDPPLRDRNAERPLLKMFAMKQGVISATSPSGGDNFEQSNSNYPYDRTNNSNISGNYSSASRRLITEQQQPSFSPSNFGATSTMDSQQRQEALRRGTATTSNIVDIPHSSSSHSRRFAQIEEL